ncbi:MAG: GIY-YIG nuclease family protein [Verrucomicrobiota bacterium]|nr:GIY-YIG nuclease family protein [Verrucomicrobiota bacterium]
MTFIDAVTEILKVAGGALTPQEIRDRIKVSYPDFYGTDSHKANVAKWHYHHLDHALMAQVYGLVKRDDFVVDRSSKPLRLALKDELTFEFADDDLSAESIEKDVGVVYVLATDTYTKAGLQIVKIGMTSGDLESRISQLHTTGVPLRFSVVKTYRISGFIELEKALHSMLVRFRLNSSREFFTEDSIPFIDRIVSLHREINLGEQERM